MPPKFSLQTVLDVRHSRVEACELELSKLLVAKYEKEQFLAQLKDLEGRLSKQLVEKQTGDLDLFMIHQLRENLRIIQAGVLQVNFDLHQLEAQVDDKRKELVAARQAEEVLGTLKAKEIERYQQEQNQQELRFLDDIYIAQGFRQRRQEA